MKAAASIINVCSAKVKLVFRTKFASGRFFSVHLALENEVSLLDIDTYIPISNQDISTGLTRKSVECFELNKSCIGFDINDIDQFGIMEETSFSHEYHQDVEDDRLRRIRVILESHGWILGSPDSYQRINLDKYNVIRILNVLYEENKDAALALYFFRWCEDHLLLKHAVQSVCTMINILISGNMNYRAIDLIQCLVRKNDGQGWWLSLVLRVLHEARFSRTVLQTAYSMLVDCYVKENMTVAALELTSQLRQFDFFPSIGVCCSLLRALLQSGQMELAWDFLEEISSRGLGSNVSIISLFIHKYCMDGDLESGWKLLTEIKNYGMNPDIVAYTKFINSLSKMSLLREATSILFKAALMGAAPDSVSISPVIDGYCKVGKMEKAFDLLKIFNLSPNTFVYNTFLSRLCADGDMLTASEVFHEMLDRGFFPDCFCYTTMIGGFCRIKDINAALSFLAKMLKKGIKLSPTTYTILTDCYCKLGDVDTAEQLFQKMVMEGLVPDLVSYNILMDGYGKRGLLHKAFQLLDMMKSTGVCPDNVTYNILIHSLIVRGFAVEAKELLDELIKRGFSPDIITLTNLVSGFAKKGNFEEAYLVWLYMGELDMKPDVVMCSALLNGYCRARRMVEANALFLKMLDMGLIPDLLLYNTLIHGFCSLSNIDSACHLIDMMIKHGISPDEVTHRALVLGFGKKWVQSPEEAAALKLKEIMLKSGIQQQ